MKVFPTTDSSNMEGVWGLSLDFAEEKLFSTASGFAFGKSLGSLQSPSFSFISERKAVWASTGCPVLFGSLHLTNVVFCANLMKWMPLTQCSTTQIPTPPTIVALEVILAVFLLIPPHQLTAGCIHCEDTSVVHKLNWFDLKFGLQSTR